ATTEAALPALADMAGYAEATSPRADVMVLAGDRRAIFQIGDAYGHGELGLVTRAQLMLSSHWILLFVATLTLALLVGWMTSRSLAKRERQRLSIATSEATEGAA